MCCYRCCRGRFCGCESDYASNWRSFWPPWWLECYDSGALPILLIESLCRGPCACKLCFVVPALGRIALTAADAAAIEAASSVRPGAWAALLRVASGSSSGLADPPRKPPSKRPMNVFIIEELYLWAPVCPSLVELARAAPKLMRTSFS